MQMRETAQALRRLGVDVEIRLGHQASDVYRDFDLVHLFNLQTPVFTGEEAQKAKAAGKPIAVSTIYWDFGAELLLTDSRIWSKLERVVGRPLSLALARKRVQSVAAKDRESVRRIIEMADFLLPNSQAEIGQLKSLTPKGKRIRVVYNGIDPQRFNPAVPHDLPRWAKEQGIASKGYVLVVARIDRHKNQATFCQAARDLGYPLVLAGQAPNAELLAACKAAGAVYVGSLHGGELVASYAHARVHALPSFRETPGLVSLEAAAMGCAIVSTAIGSVHEYFEDDAHYCDPWSASSMREAVRAAWSTGPPAGLADKIRERFSWAAAGDTTLAAYELLLAQV